MRLGPCRQDSWKPRVRGLLWVSWLLAEGSRVGVRLCRTGRGGAPPRRLGSWEAPALLSPPELSLLFSPRIKGWWVSHHYVSTFLSGVMLTW